MPYSNENVLEHCLIFQLNFIFLIHIGTHISNTREAKAFALLSEEGIAKGIRRITAVTTDCAFKAIELAHLLEQEVDEASKAEGSLLEKVGFFIFSPFVCFVFWFGNEFITSTLALEGCSNLILIMFIFNTFPSLFSSVGRLGGVGFWLRFA